MTRARLLAATCASFALAGVAAAQTAPAARAAPATKASPAVPPSKTGAAATPAQAAQPATPATPAAAPTGDLVATAQAAGQFSTLLKAAELTKLTPVLKSAGPLTLFAPTDAAFAALPAGELDRLMKSPAELQKLLLAHVVNTKVLNAQIAGTKGQVQNGAGANLNIDGSGGSVKVNGATVVKPDVMATNGVIHVIDRLILPADTMATAAPAGAGANASATEQAAPTPTP